MRPVERQVGNVGGFSVPLGFVTAGGPGAPTVVEVVSVLERTIPKGRSDLALTLPQVASPVVEHQWRLLLPEGARYRFKRGDLRPVHEVAPGGSALQATPRGLTDRISTGATVTEGELAKVLTARELSKELQQGMVGGVKPLPVTIPETGKVLLLTGALPPAKIGVEIEVKGKR